MKFSIKDFFSKCDQIHRKLRIWLHLLKKSLMENFIFCAVSCDHRKNVKKENRSRLLHEIKSTLRHFFNSFILKRWKFDII